MAYCTNCGNNISDLAVACPQCGHPTGVPGTTPAYADFWSRAAAWLIDNLILAIPSFVLGVGFLVVGLPFFGRAPFHTGFRFFSPVGYLVPFLYHWLTIAYWNGQTIGKRLLNIRITRPDGSPVDPTGAAARAGMRLVSGAALGLGFLWAAWDPEKRTWHDSVANTRAFRVYS